MINERYPIGQYEAPESITQEIRDNWIEDISTFPTRLKEIVESINEEDQHLTYREGAWSIRQLVHHIADAQINVYTRIKLALTEENPTIKPFEENGWAALADSNIELASSLSIIQGLHARLSYLLANLSEEQLKKTFIHPDTGIQTVEKTMGFCVWHVNHHLAHIKNALEKRNH
ncbi:YfiT family bacillithiol transferase [Lysinibacillus telephonicus]|uniref:YfiT family bacillithiol transferase n=1 Tax=Lysinibacillus telephonicus TaxID=1714840 RepID=UPI003B9F8483